MIRSSGLLYTDKQGKEVREDSTVLFELSANDADTHQYVANCVPPHWHDELEIFWLMEGRVRVGIGEETHELQAGEGCLINAGVLHSVTGAVQEACRFRSFVFDASIVSGMPGGVFDVKYIRPLIEKGPTFLRLDLAGADTACLRAFQCAFDACEKEEPGFEFRVREALTEILLNVLKKCRLEPTRARPDAGEKRLKQMLTWMDAHIDQPATLGEIAASANVCPRECQRIFRRYLHASPIEYMQRRRIFTAAQLLATTDRAVTEIALDCGFASPSYFTKQFRKMVGAAPMEYRKAHT